MRIPLYVLVTALAASSSLPLLADEITFTLGSSVTLSQGGSFTGDLLIDTATGGVISGDMLFVPLSGPTLHVSGPVDYEATLGDVSDGGFMIEFEKPGSSIFVFLLVPGLSLIDYPGGPVCTVNLKCANEFSGLSFSDPSKNESFLSGSLTPVGASSTPEPSSIVLLATGLLGAIGAIRRNVFDL